LGERKGRRVRPPFECCSDGGEKGADALGRVRGWLAGTRRSDGVSETYRVLSVSQKAPQDRLAGLPPRDARVLSEPIQNSHQKLGVRMIERDCRRVRRCHFLPIYGNMLPIVRAWFCWTDMDGLGAFRPNAGREPIEMIRGAWSREAGAGSWLGGDGDVVIWSMVFIGGFLRLLREDRKCRPRAGGRCKGGAGAGISAA
jgi:hypothetical protein